MVPPNCSRRTALSMIGTIALSGCAEHSLRSFDNSSPPDPRWEFDDVQAYSDPIVTDGTVFVSAAEGLVAVDADDGSRKFVIETERPPSGRPAIYDETVCVPIRDAKGDIFLRAFDADDGSDQWRTPPDERRAFGPAIVDGIAYLRGREAVHALDVTDGDHRWATETGTPYEYDRPFLDPAPTIEAGTLYAPSQDGIVALDPDDGAVLWETPIEASYATPSVEDGVVYATGASAGAAAFDADSGERLWTWEETGCWTSPAVVGDRVFVTAGSDLVTLDADSGAERGRADGDGLRGDVFSSPRIVDELLVLGSLSMLLVAFEIEDSPRERWRLDGKTRTTVAIDDRILYTVDGDRLTALDLD